MTNLRDLLAGEHGRLDDSRSIDQPPDFRLEATVDGDSSISSRI